MLNGYFRTIGSVVAVSSHILWDLSTFLGDKRDLPPFFRKVEDLSTFHKSVFIKGINPPHTHTHTTVYYQCNMIEERTFQH